MVDGVSAKAYADVLQTQADNEPNMYIKDRIQSRINKLRGGLAVLKIGASTDFERDYLRLKAEDAVKAVQAALEEGVVEGGGIALWRIAEGIKEDTIGNQILKKALSAPFIKILNNAGKDYSDVVRKLPNGMGYDAKNDKYVDMIESGIIDPTKVERCAIENAVSSASTFITSSCLITDHETTNK